MTKCGYVAILGAPNSGKSTLLNAILGEKIAIVTDRPQTTRQRLAGIHTSEAAQIIFLDTPGIHHSKKQLNRFMADEIRKAVADADILAYLVAVDAPVEPEFEKLLRKNRQKYPQKKSLIVENKIDLKNMGPVPRHPHPTASPSTQGATEGQAPKSNTEMAGTIFPMALQSARLLAIDGGPPLGPPMSRDKNQRIEIFQISAKTGEGVPKLIKAIASLLPEGPFLFPEDDLTDRNLRDLAGDIIREKATTLTFEEIPYSLTVDVTSFKESPEITRIEANLVVERDSQKGILIGQGASMIKKIGTEARADLERLLGTKVFLKLDVKVDKNWTKDSAKLSRYGYRMV